MDHKGSSLKAAPQTQGTGREVEKCGADETMKRTNGEWQAMTIHVPSEYTWKALSLSRAPHGCAGFSFKGNTRVTVQELKDLTRY